MFVKLHRVDTHTDGSYYLSEVRLNTSYISYIVENVEMRNRLKKGLLNIGLHSSTTFTNITVSSNKTTETIIVVGSPDLVESKISKHHRQLLRG